MSGFGKYPILDILKGWHHALESDVVAAVGLSDGHTSGIARFLIRAIIDCLLAGDIPCAGEQYHFLPRIAEEAEYSHH